MLSCSGFDASYAMHVSASNFFCWFGRRAFIKRQNPPRKPPENYRKLLLSKQKLNTSFITVIVFQWWISTYYFVGPMFVPAFVSSQPNFKVKQAHILGQNFLRRNLQKNNIGFPMFSFFSQKELACTCCCLSLYKLTLNQI